MMLLRIMISNYLRIMLLAPLKKRREARQGSVKERSRMASRGIVREALTEYNYEEWRTLMKSYLRGENLWDVVVRTDSTFTSIDAQRDAKALHIIQLSCGPKIFEQIKKFETAKEAWNHLSAVCSLEFKAIPDIRHGTHYVFRCILKSFFVCYIYT